MGYTQPSRKGKGFVRSLPKDCFSGYLNSRGVSDADGRIEAHAKGVDLENDLNKFLLHSFQGGEPVPGLQVVREEVGGTAGWVDLEYPSNESEQHEDRPRNRMVQDMMSKLGLKPVSRPRKHTGFHNRAVMKGRLYFDAESDTSEIPFLYRYQKNKQQYFLLVAMRLS
ncbi:hypothetical protein PSENEW3_00002474 [Picochlorum sp. SENEW3]|nr:hypothetical protein PSENEW3_00002474 [Picochlorum sp. SENEW3]